MKIIGVGVDIGDNKRIGKSIKNKFSCSKRWKNSRPVGRGQKYS